MSEYEKYLSQSGQTIEKYKDGPNYIVSCVNEDGSVQWHRQFRNINDANFEYERWRKVNE